MLISAHITVDSIHSAKRPTSLNAFFIWSIFQWFAGSFICFLIIFVTFSPKSSAFVFFIVEIKSSFIIALFVSAHSHFSTTFFLATFKYIIALNFNAVLVFSVSFLNAFKAATDFGLIFPIAFLAASILGKTVLNS